MATPLDNLKQQIQDLETQLGKVGSSIPFISNLAEAREQIRRLNSELEAENSIFNSIADNLNRLVDGTKTQAQLNRENNKHVSNLADISSKLAAIKGGELDISKKQLEALRLKAKAEMKSIQDNGAMNRLSQEALTLAEKFNESFLELERIQKRINDNGAVKTFSGLADITKSIPGLRAFSEPFETASKAAKDIVRNGGNGLDAFKAGGKELMSTFKGAGFTVLIQQLVDAFIKTDKLTGDIAKNMNLSYHSALETTTALTSIANSSGSNFVTTKGLAETYISINKTLGTSVMLSQEQLVTFTKLREIAGLTNEELMGIESISLATGIGLEQNTKEFLGQAQITATNKGIVLNTKDLFKSIKDISAATTLSLDKNIKLIGETLATTKSLGIEMSKIESIQNSLMDFETSIENELSAEWLLGRNITLEKARQAALNNDIAGLATEIASQIGTANEFGNMNLIQQESIAKSVGMNREELAKTLYIQEQLKGVSKGEAEIRQSILNKRIAEVGLAQAQKEIGEKGFETLKNQASMQDRFTKSVEKLKELLVSIVEPFMPLLDIFTELLNIVGAIMKILDPIFQAVGAILAPFSDLFNGTVKERTYTNAAKQRLENSFQQNWIDPFIAGDVISPSNGRTQISTKEGGLLQLSSNDDVVAAPGIAKRLNQASTTVVNDMSETNNLLRQILIKQGNIKIDNTDIGTAFTINSYQIQ